ncbi:MAG: porin [Betaproteobacteria bacterium]|nr:porin [Betaproteobacteria bacterium]
MQKKLLAVALAGAFGAPSLALAQSSTVQVFGTLYVEYTVRANQGDATAFPGSARTNTDFIQTPGSEIGFKGEEKLGGGLSAWFQCASTADVRGDTQNGWCSRNSAVGLKGGFGNLYVGVWDTPFKRTVSPTAVGGNDTGIWGTAFLLLSDSTTDAVGGNRLSFKRRQKDSINYDSPNFGGFQVMAAFTSAQPSTGTLASASNDKPRVYSLGTQYSAGPLYVSAGYEQHRDFAGAGPTAPANSKDSAWHIGAAYTWGPVRVGGQYTRQKFDAVTLAGADGDIRVSAWHLGVDWSIVGPHGLRASFTQARDVKGPAGAATGLSTAVVGGAGNSLTLGNVSGAGYRPGPGSDTGANLITLRYVYTFSKRTEFTAGYARLNNDSNAAYRLGGLGAQIRNGETEDAWALGIRHTF